MRLLALLFLLPSICFAQIDVQVKQAKALVSSVTISTTQVVTEDGIPIGLPKKQELDPVVSNGKSVAILFVKTKRPIKDLLVKLKSKTTDPYMVEPGVYAVTTPGTHEIEINVIGQNPLSWDDTNITVTVGTSPGPSPTPGPTPGPPIVGEGLRVLFISESKQPVPQDLQEAFYSLDVTSFLNSVCVKVDGTPDFRRLDPDTKFTDPNHRFAKALARPRTTLPWIIISNGTTGYEGPFPGGKSATLELIRSFVPLQTPVTFVKAPLVVMYSLPSCGPCKTWKEIELPKMVGVNFKMKEPIDGVSKVPTFDIYLNNKSTRLVGYQTADSMLAIIEGMK